MGNINNRDILYNRLLKPSKMFNSQRQRNISKEKAREIIIKFISTELNKLEYDKDGNRNYNREFYSSNGIKAEPISSICKIRIHIVREVFKDLNIEGYLSQGSKGSHHGEWRPTTYSLTDKGLKYFDIKEEEKIVYKNVGSKSTLLNKYNYVFNLEDIFPRKKTDTYEYIGIGGKETNNIYIFNKLLLLEDVILKRVREYIQSIEEYDKLFKKLNKSLFYTKVKLESYKTYTIIKDRIRYKLSKECLLELKKFRISLFKQKIKSTLI